MPSVKTIKNYFKFIRGLITEASPLTFPPDTCLDMSNMDVYRTGMLARRKGLTAENNFKLQPAAPFAESIVVNGGICARLWISAAEQGDNNLLTVQIGKNLYFHDMSATGALSRNQLATVIDMTAYVSNLGGDPGKYTITAASAQGALYISSPILNLFYLTYDPTTQVITGATTDPMIRDLEGLDDGLAPDENPTTLSPAHNYNLLNQGWTATTITAYFTQFQNYPSNSQVWWESKDASGNFDPAGMADIQFGTGQVSKGHFLLNLYDQDRTAVSGVAGLTPVIISTRATGMVFWLGRLFIAIEDTIYFSQIIQSPNDAFLFYQYADPASEIDPSLVTSDGGVIPISNCGKINALLVTQTGLVIGASNGIWVLTGYSGNEFNATSYRTLFVSNIGVGGNNNMVVVENTVFVVSDGGIYRIGTSDRGNPEIANLTETTIQTFFLDIPRAGRQGSTLFYDQTAKKVYMFYDADADIRAGFYRNQYDSALVFDLTIGAWVPYQLAQPALYDTGLYDAFFLSAPRIIGLDQPVIDSTGQAVLTLAGEQVLISDEIPLINETNIGYLLVSGQNGLYNYTFGEFANSSFYDWAYLDAGQTSYNSYFITGYEILEDVVRRKSLPYLWAHFERTETTFLGSEDDDLVFDFPSSCFCVSIWDWTNDNTAFRRSNPQQLYRLNQFVAGAPGESFNYPFDVIQTKTSLRGHGKCVSLYFYSEEAKDLRMWGWALELQIKTTPS